MNLWPHLQAEAREPYFSDHALICVTIKQAPAAHSRTFRFFNHLTTHKDFTSIVETESSKPVHGTNMVMVWNK